VTSSRNTIFIFTYGGKIRLSTPSSRKIQGDVKATSMEKLPPWVAIGRQFSHCPEVLTLGVRPSFAEYEPWENELLFSGRTVYFPTRRFVDIFQSSGIPTYPNWRYYQYIGNKFKQTLLFQALGVPHPRTRFYWGARKASGITKDFSFPFIAKIGRGSSRGRGVFLIRNQSDLDVYCKTNRYQCCPVKKLQRNYLKNLTKGDTFYLTKP